MVTIVKAGNRPKLPNKLFRCERCGCEFLADIDETVLTLAGFILPCPTCKVAMNWTDGKEHLK